jgi:uncharacterized protein (DUF2141 family)
MRGLGKWAPFAAVLLFLVGISLTVGCNDNKTTNPPVNHPPNQPVVMVSPGSVAAGGTATITVQCTDPDGDALTFSYQANGGSVIGSGAMATWTAPAAAGTYQVSVIASDGKATSLAGTGSLTVTGGGSTTTGTITGAVHLPPGLPGDLSNSRVAIYQNYDDWNNDRIIMQTVVQGSGANVTFTLTNVPPGNYYLDVWQDTNGDTFFDAGDWWGVNGTSQWPSPNFAPISVIAGQTSTANIIMISRP